MSQQYDGSSIQVLEGREAVRKRPGMYIGGTSKRGFHHLLWEVADNAIDESLSGYAANIWVSLSEDLRTVTVRDDGRGIPVDIHPTKGISSLEVVFTILHAGAKFTSQSYGASGGLHGVGASVVNFLSSELHVKVQREGKIWEQWYDQGNPKDRVKHTGSCPKSQTGTTVTFTPDPEIFGDQVFDPELIKERLDLKAYLNPKVRIHWEYGQDSECFHHEGGIAEYLGHVLKDTPTHPDPITIDDVKDGVTINIALQWTDSTREDVRSFVNAIPTASGGTHENGFRSGLMKAVRMYMDLKHDKAAASIKGGITTEDIREGLCAVVSVFFAGDMEIEGQTKERLNNAEIQPIVAASVKKHLENFFLANTDTADVICNRILQAARARMASRSASLNVRRKKAVGTKLLLPGKLSDCTSNDPSLCEIFLTEGDSAAGTGKLGRDRETQAILPLRGKILNTESASNSAISQNKEIGDIIEALGCGVGPKFNKANLRYHKIILLMDADSDGHHITTLLLTFFYRYMPQLIFDGHIYIAQPPLYRITCGNDRYWAEDDKERDKILKKLGNKKSEVSRFKGLGEMMKDTLRETVLDPKTRHLLQVDAPAHLDGEIDTTIKSLMGRSSQDRYTFIMDHIGEAEDIDV